MGDPEPLDPVALAGSLNRQRMCSCHQSRSGPAVEFGRRVSQTPFSGKYAYVCNIHLPDGFQRSSASPAGRVHSDTTIDFIDLPFSTNYVSLDLRTNQNAAILPVFISPPRRNLTLQSSSTPSSTLPPERTACRLMGDPEPPDPVALAGSLNFQRPYSCHQSRSGPAVELGRRVSQTPFSGKYLHDNITSRPDTASNSSCFNGCLGTLRSSSSSTLLPERTACRTMGDPEPLDPVALAGSLNLQRPYSCHQSRSGPAVEFGERVSQTPLSGMYPHDNIPPRPDTALNSSDINGFADSPADPLCLRIQPPEHPPTHRSEITVYYQNVRGMNSDVDDYRVAISDVSFDIIILTETWLDSRTLSHQVFGNDYEVFRCDRSADNSRKATGGGVLIAVSSRLTAMALDNTAWRCLEQVWTSIKLGDRTLFLCAWYIPPDRTRERDLVWTHCQSVYSVLESANATDEVMVIGDFNLPGISWRRSSNGFLFPDVGHSTIHPTAAFLLDNYSSATLAQISQVTNRQNRSLDLCFVSAQDMPPTICEAPTHLVKLDPLHPPLLVTIGATGLGVPDLLPAIVSYNFRKADHRSISDLLSRLDWNEILDSTDVECAAQTLSNVLAYLVDRHVPKRILHPSSRTPWQTRELRRLKTEKKAALRRFIKYRTMSLQRFYVRINHVYKRIAKRCYLQYRRGLQSKLKSRPQQFWKFVKEQRQEAGLPSSMSLDGNVASTPEDICRLFSEKFASVFTDERLSDDQIHLAASNVPLSGQSMGRIDIDRDMISKAFLKLKSTFNPGPDGIPSAFLKTHMNGLIPALLHVFQLSVTTGVFPSCWKQAHMFPVHKKGNKRAVENYRGITSLCAVAKLFELVIVEPLLTHCKQYISDDQHGFTAGRSTATNLLCLTSYVTDSMQKRDQTDVIYTDLTAAFDKLNHRIAIAKLDRLGIAGSLLNWFRSYLTNRRIAVVIKDCQSPVFDASSGIPQGSHLGPLIFLIYFNDVNLVIRGPRLSYADDLKIYLRIHSIEDCRFLQRQLNAFADWCMLNRMVVNPSKCSVISFSRKRNSIIFDYRLLDTEIERVDQIKDLGVVLDSQLSFKQHVSYAVDKASKVLGFIFRIAKDFTDIYCLKSLYCSLSRSILEYCSVVWNPYYNNGVERVESVQRRFLRFALRRLPWSDPFRLPRYEDRLMLIRLEPLSVRRNTARALFVVDLLQGHIDCPALLQQVNMNVRPRALRNNSMLRLPPLRTNYSRLGALNGLQRLFNRVSTLFDFGLSRQLLRQRFSSFFSR